MPLKKLMKIISILTVCSAILVGIFLKYSFEKEYEPVTKLYVVAVTSEEIKLDEVKLVEFDHKNNISKITPHFRKITPRDGKIGSGYENFTMLACMIEELRKMRDFKIWEFSKGSEQNPVTIIFSNNPTPEQLRKHVSLAKTLNEHCAKFTIKVSSLK
jgi:hypothetical protein